MIEDEKITKAIASLAKQVNTIELNMKEQDRKEYERKNNGAQSDRTARCIANP